MKKTASRITAFTLAIIMALFSLSFAVSAKSTAAKKTAKKPEREGMVVFLLYHDLVADKLTDANDPEYTTTGEKFRSDIRSLLDEGWISISSEMYMNGEYEADKDYFVVTFDDGYLSNYTVAYPILKELEVYGDIFMCTENVLLKNHFKWSQAKEMEKSGFIKLYSHTTKHQDLKTLGAASFCVTVERSLIQLKTKLGGERVQLFSYPGSDYSRETVERLAKLGVKLQFVQIMPKPDCGWDYKALGVTQRISIAYKTDVKALIEEVFGDGIFD